MENKTTEKSEILEMMEAFDAVVDQYVKTDWGKRTALVEEFCDCCSVSFPDKPKVSPQSPLAFAFFSFVNGVECGQSQAADSETE